VPTINLHGEADGVGPVEASAGHARFFTGPYQRRTIPRVGHNVPQEAPRETAQAVMELVGTARS
jgi:pimeloyl-ACP methyl ester carboxylesterase